MNDKNLNMICHLSGFHTLMSLLESIDNYMAGSGIEQASALVYAPNTIYFPFIRESKHKSY